MFGRHLYTAAMSIQPDREALFNEVYDAEHIPELKQVPGVLDVLRYRRVEPAEQFYLAIYRIAGPHVPTSEAWLKARDRGRWPHEIRPYASGLQNGLYAYRDGWRSVPASDLASATLLWARGDGGPEIDDRVTSAARRLSHQPGVVGAGHYVDSLGGGRLLVVALANGDDGSDHSSLAEPAGLALVELYAPV